MARILAIDDENSNLMVMNEILSKIIPDCTIMVAQSGACGIEKAFAELPDTVLTDVEMPGMDGFEVCRRLKSDDRTKHIPVVLLAAVRADSNSYAEGLQVGADGFLAKPVQEAELAGQVNAMLRIKRAEDLLRSEKELLESVVERRTRELRASEERCRRITEAVTDYIFTVCINSGQPVQTIHRPGCIAVTGYTPEEYGANPYLWICMVHEEDRYAVEEQSKRLLLHGDAEPVEHRMVRKDGSVRWVRNTLVPHYDSQGNLVSYDGLIRDITERKLAEEALRVSEEKFRLAFENAVDAIFWADPATGLITNCNKAAESLLERGRDEVIGQPQITLHPPQKAEYYSSMFRSHVEKHVTKNGSMDDEAEVITKSGKIVPVHITASVTLVKGEPIIQGIFRDITERKRAEEALRESEQKYSTLVENSPTGIYMDQAGKIVFANDRLAEIYRYPREELVGADVRILGHPKDGVLIGDSGTDVLSEYEAQGLTRDGRTIWVKNRNMRIEYKGEPAMLGNVVNITQQRQAEERLRKINEELENFVGIVSHDLKTPIISIQGFSSRLLRKYGEGLDNKGQEYLEQINASARRMEVFVSDLLALSRIGSVVSSFRQISSFDIVQSVISSLQDRLEKNDTEVIVANNLPTIYCDGERIRQVFENLLVNAVKFTSGNEEPVIEIGCEDKRELDQFFVKDNGIGIDPTYHNKIFEMFHRLKKIKDEEGSGLGLAIVDRIVTSHGGKVWVESETGKGATFYFTLPRRLSEN